MNPPLCPECDNAPCERCAEDRGPWPWFDGPDPCDVYKAARDDFDALRAEMKENA